MSLAGFHQRTVLVGGRSHQSVLPKGVGNCSGLGSSENPIWRDANRIGADLAHLQLITMKPPQRAVTKLSLECALKGSLPIAATAQALQTQNGNRVARKLAWQGFRRLVSGNHVLAWADQAVVSATSFLALILIGRWTEPSQLGAYAIGGSILALLLAAQESLITRPYSIQLHRPLGTPTEHAFSSLLLSFLLSVVGIFVLSAAALALSAFGAHRGSVEITWALAGTVPFVLMREFARRFAFAHLKMFQALMVDVAVAALSVASLGWLGWTGRLSAVTAFGAVGISCGIGAIGWLYLARAEFAFRLGHVRATLKQSWVLGKWLFSSQLAVQAQGYMTYWLSLVIAGATVTGIYTACVSIVSFANPLLFGFFNILTPRSVRTFRKEGGAGLRRQAAWDSALLAGVMTPFCVLVFLVGEDVMRFLYPGPAYTGNGDVLVVIALATLAAAIGAPASNALASAERGPAVASVTTATAALNLVLVWWFMTNGGLLGAAYGILIAEAIGSLGRWIAFLALVPELSTHRPDPDTSSPAQTVRVRLTEPNSPGGTLS